MGLIKPKTTVQYGTTGVFEVVGAERVEINGEPINSLSITFRHKQSGSTFKHRMDYTPWVDPRKAYVGINTEDLSSPAIVAEQQQALKKIESIVGGYNKLEEKVLSGATLTEAEQAAYEEELALTFIGVEENRKYILKLLEVTETTTPFVVDGRIKNLKLELKKDSNGNYDRIYTKEHVEANGLAVPQEAIKASAKGVSGAIKVNVACNYQEVESTVAFVNKHLIGKTFAMTVGFEENKKGDIYPCLPPLAARAIVKADQTPPKFDSDKFERNKAKTAPVPTPALPGLTKGPNLPF
jgi:hypothetical protein